MQEISNVLQSKDQPTTFAHPGWRAAYTFVSWGILGITVSEGNSLFVGLMILGWGLLVDYFKFIPKTKLRRLTRTAGAWWAAVLLITNLLGSFGALNIQKGSAELEMTVKSFPFFTNAHFPVKWYWLVTGISVILTLVDWISEKRELEVMFVDSVDEQMSGRMVVATTESEVHT